MDAKQKLKRFCYLGNFEPVYIRPRVGLKVEKLYPPLKELISTLDDVAFVGYMSDILKQSDHLPRKDEAIFAYATYLGSEVDIKFKTNVRKVVPLVLKTAEELFMFCKYSKSIQQLQGRKGLSRTTKKAVVAWYEKCTPEELREMWKSHRGMYGFSHKNLIYMCHINDETLGDETVCQAFLKTCSELIKEDELKNEDVIMEMSTLRTTTKKNEATKIIKNLRLTWDQVPPNLFKFPNIVEMLLPEMSLLDIIKKWHTFHQHRHFDNTKLFRTIVSLTNREALQKANIHPSVFLWRMDRLGIPIAASELQKVPEKRAITMRMSVFQQMYRDSFSLNRAVGLRSFVTMTLQDNYKKKFLTKHKKVTYYEAAISFAFSYFKREKYTDIFAYTEDKVKLAQIPWEKGIQLNQAMEVCDHFTYKKSSQRLVQPLMEALNRKQVYDLFLIIVPSAGRSNPNQNSSFLCRFLDKYREMKNKKAKFVIISLLKHKKSMSYSTERNENILEICGLDSNTANVIDSFALNRFG
ncbi:RNA-binding protein RO60 [Eupeodes corollae]|uniref:RNA-binding protein RO60 n=1 Tax=Eupeodes corollae TaxID=290404 RepID=UPI0024915976|nr:RNA-binding protein RO60 [Eupeodes corollae]XP_055913133.1 RNA-binding protein RO60 [Eupeodes corollae]